MQRGRTSMTVCGGCSAVARRRVVPKAGEHVVVSGAAGGVGSITVQLVRRTGAETFGLAGEHNHGWLRDHGITPLTYGDGMEERIRSATGNRVDAFIDTFGGGYVDLAIDLGVPPDRIDTIIDFEAAARLGVKADGSAAGAGAATLAELAHLIAQDELEVPVAATFPLSAVQDAYRELEKRHTRGKIVLIP